MKYLVYYYHYFRLCHLYTYIYCDEINLAKFLKREASSVFSYYVSISLRVYECVSVASLDIGEAYFRQHVLFRIVHYYTDSEKDSRNVCCSTLDVSLLLTFREHRIGRPPRRPNENTRRKKNTSNFFPV